MSKYRDKRLNETVDTTISYADLEDKPTIPSALSQLTTDDNNQRVSMTEKTKTQQQIIFTYTL